MKAYKFRAASQFAFALDIIFNRRLYCADWRTLNDPMEGRFVCTDRGPNERDLEEEVAKIIEEKDGLRISSLSQTFDSHLLWAHYASGFDGLAVEVELPDDSDQIKTLRYRGVFASISVDKPFDAYETARQILSSKYKEWEYEKEVRVLQRGDWFRLGKPVSRVIAGHRMNPALFRALRMVCEREGIELCRTGIGDEGIDADRVLPLEPGTKRSHGRARRSRVEKAAS